MDLLLVSLRNIVRRCLKVKFGSGDLSMGLALRYRTVNVLTLCYRKYHKCNLENILTTKHSTALSKGQVQARKIFYELDNQILYYIRRSDTALHRTYTGTYPKCGT